MPIPQEDGLKMPTTADILPWLNEDKRALIAGGAVVSTLGTALAFLSIFAIRGGLGDDPSAVLMMCASVLLPICLSACAMNHYGSTPLGASALHASGFFAGILLPLAGLAVGKYAGWAVVVLFLAALGSNAARIRQARVAIGLKGFFAILGFAAILLLTMGAQRLFLPEAMTLGAATSDSYFHAAIAQMILHFGTPSLGADGLIFHHYHTLSHALVAGYAGSSGTSVPLVYLYWGGIALKAQLVWCLYSFVILFAKPAHWSQLTAITVGLAYAWLSLILISGLESESFLLSLALLSAALPLLVTLMTAQDGTRHLRLALAMACAATLICAGAKVSSGFFSAIALVVIAWNLRRRWDVLAAVMTTFLLLALLTRFALTPRDLTMWNTTKVVLLGSYMQYLIPETVFSYALPLGLVAVLTQSSAFPASDQGRLSRALYRFLQAQNLVKFLILATLGCIAVLFTSLIGSNNQFFSATLYAIALLLLPAALARTPGTAALQSWAPAIVATLLVASLTPAFSKFAADCFTTIVSIYQKAEQANDHIRIGADVRASMRQTHTPFANLKKRMDATPWAQLLDVVKTENIRAGGKLAVQIQPDANDVWHRLQGGTDWWCMAPHLMVPAETGVIEIRSIAPRQIEQACAPPGIVWYGFGEAQDAHRAANLTDRQLCALARPAGVRKIYHLLSYRELSRNWTTACPG